jgi:2-dehydropantoate 2-reductase
MKSIVMGAGGIGAYVGGMLTRAGRHVDLIDQWPAHVDAMQSTGLSLTVDGEPHRIDCRAHHIFEAQGLDRDYDVVFLAVKTYDTGWATVLASGFLGSEGVVVCMQNGMYDEVVAHFAGRERTVGCVVQAGGSITGPGEVDVEAGYGFAVGELTGPPTRRVERLVALLNEVAPTVSTDDLIGDRWAKLGVNCRDNAVAGLTGLGAQDLQMNADARRVGIHICGELVAVVRARHENVGRIAGIESARYQAAARGERYEELDAEIAAGAVHFESNAAPSLLQDIRKHRRTEIDDLNGFIVREGARLGVPTPVNAAVVEVVRAQEHSKIPPEVERLAPVLATLPG